MTYIITSKVGSDVANAVRRQFGDESGVQVKDADFLRWINDGQRSIVAKNKVLKGKATLAATPGQADYDMPAARIANIESIHINNIPIPGLSYPDMEKYIEDHPYLTADATGTPVLWYQWGGLITLWPTPTQADMISLLYTAFPPELTSLSEALSLPDKYFNVLIDYVLSKAYELDEEFDASSFKSQQYENQLHEMADEERSTANMTYPVINDVVDY